jgi:hypothetical protein
MDGTGSGSCPMAASIGGVKSSDSTTTVLVR